MTDYPVFPIGTHVRVIDDSINYYGDGYVVNNHDVYVLVSFPNLLYPGHNGRDGTKPLIECKQNSCLFIGRRNLVIISDSTFNSVDDLDDILAEQQALREAT